MMATVTALRDEKMPCRRLHAGMAFYLAD